jgi:hypothetical protein
MITGYMSNDIQPWPEGFVSQMHNPPPWPFGRRFLVELLNFLTRCSLSWRTSVRFPDDSQKQPETCEETRRRWRLEQKTLL